MSSRLLSEVIVLDKYARSGETWEDAVARYFAMHERKFGFRDEEAIQAVKDKRVLPSMRGLQFGGEPIERRNGRMYNCAFANCTRPRYFAVAFYHLLCGTGTGFSVKRRHIDQLPNLRRPAPYERRTHYVQDTIEGWADALDALVNSYFYEGVPSVDFDYSEVRLRGATISSGSGKAPGPDPLRRALDNVRRVLEGARGRLTSLEAFDIVMHSADAVLSGGVRRSATIALCDPDDQLMMNAKAPGWWEQNPQRGRANISCVRRRDKTTREEYTVQVLSESNKKYGEPGVIWIDKYGVDAGYNPCCLDPNTLIATSEGLKPLRDLQGGVLVASDTRFGVGDEADHSAEGVRILEATNSFVTQKSAPVYRVTTCKGYTILATDNHKFLTKRGRLELRDVQVGDYLPLQSAEGAWGSKGTYEAGLVLGMLAGDGTFMVGDSPRLSVWEDDFSLIPLLQDAVDKVIDGQPVCPRGVPGDYQFKLCKQQGNKARMNVGGARLRDGLLQAFGDVRECKHGVPEGVLRGSREAVCGYLQGLFAADGTVLYSESKACLSLRLASISKDMLQGVQALLANFGIVAAVYGPRAKAGKRRLPKNDGSGDYGLYDCKDSYELIMSRNHAEKFYNTIGLIGPKGERLKALLDTVIKERYRSKFWDKVQSVEYVDDREVWCINQPLTNTIVANGIAVGQCEINLLPTLNTNNDVVQGWQMCNLTTINAAAVESVEDFITVCKIAARIGTYQAAYTSFPYLGNVTEKIVQRDALLGVSLCGVMSSPMFTVPAVLRAGAQAVLEENERVAKRIGINSASRTTCVKPEGTASLVLESSSGVHAWPAKRYIRHVQLSNNSDIARKLRDTIHYVGPSVYAPDTTDCFAFAVTAPAGARTEADTSALDQLRVVQTVQENWVRPGTRRGKLEHNVSNTIKVGPEEWEDVAEYIYDNRRSFAGVAMLARDDHEYAQAPHTAVTSDNELFFDALTLSEVRLDSTEKDNNFAAEPACAGGTCEIP